MYKYIFGTPKIRIPGKVSINLSIINLNTANKTNQIKPNQIIMQLCCSIRRVQLLTLLVAGFTIISILLILFFFNYPHFARLRTIDAVVYKNNSEAMDRFLTTKEFKNLRLSFYVFNVTNYDEVVKSSAKINLTEIGPFVYSEYKVKELVDNNQTSGLITYRLRTRYTLDKNLSIADPETTLITWPNVPLLVAKAYLDKLSYIPKTGAYFALNKLIQSNGEPPFITDTVNNFIFNGSERQFFVKLQKSILSQFVKPWPLPDNKFGLLYKKNDTINPLVDHKLTVSAGFGLNQTYHNLNTFIYFNDSRTLPYWQSFPPNCNSVGGTDGQAFPPFLDRPQVLEIYSAAVCRKLQLKFRQNSYIFDINSSRYTLDERSMQSGKKYQPNECYCLTDYTDSACKLDGLIDLSNCVTPSVYASGAHFFSGSNELLTRINGLTAPVASLHEPEIIVEPNTGLVVKVNAPLQLNVKLDKGGFNIFDFFKDDTPLYIPLLWINESGELTEDQASLLRSKLLLLDSWFVTMVLGGAIVLVSTILIIAIILCVQSRNMIAIDPSETEPLISPKRRLSTVSSQGRTSQQQEQQHDQAQQQQPDKLDV